MNRNTLQLYGNYSELPLFLIKNNPFTFSGKQSYGGIILASDTMRWLIVKRKHPNALVQLTWGTYQKSELPSMLNTLSDDQLLEVKQCTRTYELFEQFYLKINTNINVDTVSYAYDRISQCIDIIDHYISRYSTNSDSNNVDNESNTDRISDHNTTSNSVITSNFVNNRGNRIRSNSSERKYGSQWGWIKGKKDGKESLQHTLIREIREESGAQIPENIGLKMFNTPITVKNKISMGNVYTNTYYLLVFNKEFEIGTEDNSEVSEKKWVSTEELYKLLPSYLVPTIELAVGLYVSTLIIPSI